MTPVARQTQIVTELKNQDSSSTIPIKSETATRVGTLVPITHRMAADSRVIEAIFRWRRDNLNCFLSVFEPSIEKTRDYLTKFSLPDRSRILFLIESADGTAVGNIGFCNIAARSAELDNVIRGEKATPSHFMRYAQTAALHWAFHALDIDVVYLNVLAHNERALLAYKNIGFSETRRTPLVRQNSAAGYTLVPAPDAQRGPNQPELARMEIGRDFFYARNPWVRA